MTEPTMPCTCVKRTTSDGTEYSDATKCELHNFKFNRLESLKKWLLEEIRERGMDRAEVSLPKEATNADDVELVFYKGDAHVLDATNAYVKGHPTDVLLVVYDGHGGNCVVTKDRCPDLAEDLANIRSKFLAWQDEQFKRETST